MTSKRFKKLPEKTKDLGAEAFEKLIPQLKKNIKNYQKKLKI